MNLNVCFIGAGNLATQLSIALQKEDNNIVQIYSRTEASGKALANILQCTYTSCIKDIVPNADVYFIALKDSVFVEVLSQLPFNPKLLVHCSGGLPLNVLKSYSKSIGVFYPLQTFSKQRKVNFKTIPVFIESDSLENEKQLLKMAESISDSVSVLNSDERKLVHLTAVFACNFVNHFYTIASNILATKEIPFDVLRPLILETALKVQELVPYEAQTGPAIRFDENIIDGHLKQLEDFSDYHKLYNLISKSIFEHHKKLS